MPLDIDSIRAARPQNEIHYFPELNSTMTEASRLAASGAPPGTVVIAEEQISGLGRLGRSWLSPPEVGIYCSVLLRLPLAPSDLPIASLVLGLATAEAIQRTTHLACDLRWPNDVLIRERKVAGILTHLVDTHIVAGIGINVNQTSMPTNLRTPATSLRIENGGQAYAREPIVIALLDSLDTFCSTLAQQGSHSILRAFTAASSFAMHRRVIVEESGIKGTTAGLDNNGFLLVRLESGKLERIASGGVRPDNSAT